MWLLSACRRVVASPGGQARRSASTLRPGRLICGPSSGRSSNGTGPPRVASNRALAQQETCDLWSSSPAPASRSVWRSCAGSACPRGPFFRLRAGSVGSSHGESEDHKSKAFRAAPAGSAHRTPDQNPPGQPCPSPGPRASVRSHPACRAAHRTAAAAAPAPRAARGRRRTRADG